VSQSVRNKLLSRLNELKSKIGDDHRAESEALDSFYNEQGRVKREVERAEDGMVDASQQVSDLKRIVSDTNQQIGDFID
jgi:predicted  nucleic acid-binding Zn-ribbon protein